MKWLLVLYVVGTNDLAYTGAAYPTWDDCQHAGWVQTTQSAQWKGVPPLHSVCRPVEHWP